jgi:hypothetical protein
MQEAAYEFPRTRLLPRTRVNRGKKQRKGQS